MKFDGIWRLKIVAVWYNFTMSGKGVKMRRCETDRTKANCTQYTDRNRRIGGTKGGNWEVAEGA